MRSVGSTVILLLVLSLFATGHTQTSSSHAAVVRIPPVLHLRLVGSSDSPASNRVIEEIDISVDEGLVRITPAGTRLQVFANTGWQLLATYAPHRSEGGPATLAWRPSGGGAWTPLTPYPQVLVADRATQRWTGIDLDYGLVRPLPPDGAYGGVVTFTLVQP
jgi:hypothetical protein